MESISNEPKWIDEEDEHIQISISNKNNLKKLKKTKTENFISGVEFQERLRDQFSKLNNTRDIYKWAYEAEDLEKADDETVESTTSLNNLLKTDKNLLDTNNSDKIGKDSTILNIKQIPNLNKESPHSSIVSAISFHPSKENIVLTSGLDKKLKIYSISRNEDNKSSNIQTVNTIDMPIFSSKFLNENEVIISGRRKHYFVYNLESNKLERCNGIGNFCQNKDIRSLEKLFVGHNNYCFGTDDGYILMYDKNNKTYRYDIKINGSVNSVCFDGNGVNLYAVGDQSEIYVFDLRKYRNCVSKFNDSGNFNTTYMDISKDNSYLATASHSGIVNLYSIEDLHNSNFKENVEPFKTVENLTTSCEFLKFSNNGNKLGFCSRWKKHAFKILNLNNMNVYSNFPTYTSRIKYPICFDFSVNDKYMCIGNDEGKALLYKLF